MTRYTIRPHKHNRDYPYDGGYALWDTATDTQYGWSRSRERAESDVRQDNEREPQNEIAVADCH